MSKYTYEVEVTYLDEAQASTIENLVRYGLWGKEEAERKKKPSIMSWEISGDKPMSKKTAEETRAKFSKQFEERGEKLESVKFKKLIGV